MQPEKQLTYKEVDEFRQQFARAAGKELFSYFAQTIKETKRLINAYKKRFVKLSDSKEEDKTLIKNLRSFNARLLEVITKYQKENLNSGISNPFKGYLDLLDSEIKPLKPTLRKKEKFENYQLIRNDSIFILLKKTGLNISLFWKLQGRKIRNVLLKIRKKPEENLEIYRWRRILFVKWPEAILA
jgi:uncharacterized membrane-anchored protein YhcB (DUF1043 family)